LHVLGNVVWIGAILAVAAVLTGSAADPKTRGELGLRVYNHLAVPAFVLSFVCGATRLALDTSYYLVQNHWMHPKITVALVAIGLHHVLGARAKKMARGAVQGAGQAAILALILALMAAAAAFFVIFRVPR
ncbi:MAG TPA: CopD family protein, partial [Candidatus Nanopelagicales bacterium]|nr:CopD family protein [Candidatus Nanopelagicales bacterium]